MIRDDCLCRYVGRRNRGHFKDLLIIYIIMNELIVGSLIANKIYNFDHAMCKYIYIVSKIVIIIYFKQRLSC